MKKTKKVAVKVKRVAQNRVVRHQPPKSKVNYWMLGVIAVGILILTMIVKSFVTNSAMVANINGSVQGEYIHEYFVSPSGSDSNNGTSSSTPFKTFAKAQTVAVAEDAIHMLKGVYPAMKVSKDGLTILGYGAVIDGTIDASKNSYATVAIDITASDIVMDGFEAMHSWDHVVHIVGKRVTFKNAYVHDGIYKNRDPKTEMALHTGWGSGIAMKHDPYGPNGTERMAEHVVIDNVLVERVYGEAIDNYGVNDVIVKNSTVKDSYSMGFYNDNSRKVVFENNFAYCSGDKRFNRQNGDIMVAYGLASERLERWYPKINWGAQLYDARIVNNVSYGCDGIRMWGTELSSLPNNGLQNSLIAHNTILKTPKADSIYLASSASHNNVRVINNVTGGKITLTAGATSSGNVTGVVYTPSVMDASHIKPTNGKDMGVALADVTSDFGGYLRDTVSPDAGAWELGAVVAAPSTVPTPTPTPTPTATPKPSATSTATPTPTPTPTATPKPSATSTAMPTPTPTPTAVPATNNTAPTIKSSWFSLHAIRGVNYSANFTVTDRNKTDSLAMSISGLPTGLSVTGCKTEDWSSEIARICTVAGKATTAGSYKLTITASDGYKTVTNTSTLKVW